MVLFLFPFSIRELIIFDVSLACIFVGNAVTSHSHNTALSCTIVVLALLLFWLLKANVRRLIDLAVEKLSKIRRGKTSGELPDVCEPSPRQKSYLESIAESTKQDYDTATDASLTQVANEKELSVHG